jgi:hypothetical protein
MTLAFQKGVPAAAAAAAAWRAPLRRRARAPGPDAARAGPRRAAPRPAPCIQITKPGPMTRDFRIDRVRILIDKEGKVLDVPRNG